MSPPNFRINAKRYFLTYPQCGELTRESVRDMLVSTHGAQYYCVARESHSDGNYHIHAYGEWCGPFSSRDVRIFDVDGCHPNIQPVRSTKRVLEYILKDDGDAISNVQPMDGGGRVSYGTILGEANSRDDFLARVASSHPRDYVVFHQRLREFCDARYPEERVEYVPRWTEFDEPAGLREWKLSLEEEVGKWRMPGGPQSPPSLLIYPLMPIV